ncbi:nudC domain-containing protein 2-like [Oncorhynchus nerka]|uniref:nudC domain-containing protein 2-like n=1 Tax=Oncorhynchus nerka TaxID=8023 RepID=UPI00113298B1|nr:nudC domain-containing protein 2-like [Oncorhynchus nerka]
MSFLLEERSGVIPCKTPRGNWSQTTEDVFIEVNVLRGTSGKEVKCNLGYKLIELHVKKATIFWGAIFGISLADEGTWTLVMCLICIVLMKTNREGGNCWSSMLEGEYCADAWLQDQMQRKLTLERFHRENSGFDFSGAEISGNFAGGGPAFYSLQK